MGYDFLFFVRQLSRIICFQCSDRSVRSLQGQDRLPRGLDAYYRLSLSLVVTPFQMPEQKGVGCGVGLVYKTAKKKTHLSDKVFFFYFTRCVPRVHCLRLSHLFFGTFSLNLKVYEFSFEKGN